MSEEIQKALTEEEKRLAEARARIEVLVAEGSRSRRMCRGSWN